MYPVGVPHSIETQLPIWEERTEEEKEKKKKKGVLLFFFRGVPVVQDASERDTD